VSSTPFSVRLKHACQLEEPAVNSSSKELCARPEISAVMQFGTEDSEEVMIRTQFICMFCWKYLLSSPINLAIGLPIILYKPVGHHSAYLSVLYYLSHNEHAVYQMRGIKFS
jgi:hypothetical protein